MIAFGQVATWEIEKKGPLKTRLGSNLYVEYLGWARVSCRVACLCTIRTIFFLVCIMSVGWYSRYVFTFTTSSFGSWRKQNFHIIAAEIEPVIFGSRTIFQHRGAKYDWVTEY